KETLSNVFAGNLGPDCLHIDANFPAPCHGADCESMGVRKTKANRGFGVIQTDGRLFLRPIAKHHVFCRHTQIGGEYDSKDSVSGDKVDTVAGKNEPPGTRLFFRRKYCLETREKRLFRVELRTPNVDLVFSYPRGGRGTAPICRKDPIGHGLRIRSRVTSQKWLLDLQRRIRIQRVSPVIHGRDARATIASWHGRPQRSQSRWTLSRLMEMSLDAFLPGCFFEG